MAWEPLARNAANEPKRTTPGAEKVTKTCGSVPSEAGMPATMESIFATYSPCGRASATDARNPNSPPLAGGMIPAKVPVAGPVPPPSMVVTPEASASSICCGQMKWMWVSMAPAVTQARLSLQVPLALHAWELPPAWTQHADWPAAQALFERRAPAYLRYLLCHKFNLRTCADIENADLRHLLRSTGFRRGNWRLGLYCRRSG